MVVTSEHIPQAMHLYAEGADFVYVPRLHSAEQIAEVIETALATGLGTLKAAELAELEKRREVVG